MDNPSPLFSEDGTRPLRDASTVVLTREGQRGLELYLQKRPAGSGFMGGAYVFPGGKVDPADRVFPDHLLGPSGERLQNRLRPTPGPGGSEGPSGAVVAVCRELFEEAGVLLARSRESGQVLGGDHPLWERVAAERGAVVGGERLFLDLLSEQGLVLALEGVVYWSHWITPSAEKRRFDTRFFVASLPRGQEAIREEHETADARWCTPAQALAAHAAGEMFLPPPTLKTIEELRDLGSWEALREQALAHPPFPVLPKVRSEERGVTILFPWDEAYSEAPGATLPGEPPVAHPQVAGASRVVFDGERWKSERRCGVAGEREP